MVKLVYELAEYERAPKQCHLTADQLRIALFGPSPALFAHVAELDREVVGCTLWFLNFSTWRCAHGIYLE
ncbi:MAG: GNAT family N-acetyltransferase, partial [Pseudonocardiaceae bacterium]